MDDNQDAIELKRRARRRLVGAIALVVFVVIVLPIIFDHEPKSLTQDLTIQIPSQDSGKGASKAVSPPPAQLAAPADTITPSTPSSQPIPVANTAPVASAAAALAPKQETKPVSGAESAEAPRADAAKPAKVEQPKPEKKLAEPKPASIPAKEAAREVSAPASKDDASVTPQAGFYVPLGVFSKSENVRQVQSKVSAAGFKSYAEKSSGSAQTKVRAGPFASREAAENARDKLKSAGMDVGPVGSR